MQIHLLLHKNVYKYYVKFLLDQGNLLLKLIFHYIYISNAYLLNIITYNMVNKYYTKAEKRFII